MEHRIAMVLFDNLSLADHQRTVWFVGAGASHAPPYETPLQKDALSRFMTMNRPGNAGAQTSLLDLREKVTNRIKEVLPGASPESVNLEHDSLPVLVAASAGLLFCLGLFAVNYRLKTATGAETPWQGSLYAAGAILAATGLWFSV